MLEPTKLMTLIANKMVWQNGQNQVHSHNIAQAETPGFKRVALKSFNEVLKSNTSTLRNNNSLLTPFMPLNENHQIQTSSEVKRDIESVEMAENSLNYQANTQLFKKYLGLMKTVIGKS